jgi:hypothetical protein
MDGKLEEQIEESLENLDSLLANIKGGPNGTGNPAKREAEILRLGQKFNIDFNLNNPADQISNGGKYGNKVEEKKNLKNG